MGSESFPTDDNTFTIADVVGLGTAGEGPDSVDKTANRSDEEKQQLKEQLAEAQAFQIERQSHLETVEETKQEVTGAEQKLEKLKTTAGTINQPPPSIETIIGKQSTGHKRLDELVNEMNRVYYEVHVVPFIRVINRVRGIIVAIREKKASRDLFLAEGRYEDSKRALDDLFGGEDSPIIQAFGGFEQIRKTAQTEAAIVYNTAVALHRVENATKFIDGALEYFDKKPVEFRDFLTELADEFETAKQEAGTDPSKLADEVTDKDLEAAAKLYDFTIGLIGSIPYDDYTEKV